MSECSLGIPQLSSSDKSFLLISTSGLESSLLQKQKGWVREFLGLGLQEEVRCWRRGGRVKKTDGLRQRNTSLREGPHENGNGAQSRRQGKWTSRLGALHLISQPSRHHMCRIACKNLNYKGDFTCFGATPVCSWAEEDDQRQFSLPAPAHLHSCKVNNRRRRCWATWHHWAHGKVRLISFWPVS